MKHRTIIGASVPAGAQALKEFTALKLGECVLTLLPTDKREAFAMADYCRKHQIGLYFSELTHRGEMDLAKRRNARGAAYTKRELNRIAAAAGESYGGRMTIGEAGGMLYWPKAYVTNRKAGQHISLVPVRRADQAHAEYVRFLREFLRYEREQVGGGPLMNVDSSLVFKYHDEAGIDILCLESMPGDPHVMHAAIRGAAKACGKPWGTHIAMGWYGGFTLDELWHKRWRAALYHAYISGAGFIWPESGHYTYPDPQRGFTFPFDSAGTKRTRRILRECYQFSRVHTRPDAEPVVTLGVVHGNHEGAPGLWNRYAWGQYSDPKWLESPAERGWALVDGFHRKEDWPNEAVQGDRDFSGNPPYGQYDAVPVEAPLAVLKSYRCLVFLGWNTMTGAIYEKLKKYVRAGGRLVMYLPHLNTETDRAKPIKLYRNGDFRDLFGVRILGKEQPDVRGFRCVAQSSLPSYRFPLGRLSTDPRYMGRFTPSRLKLTGARVITIHADFYEDKPGTRDDRAVLTEQTLGKGKAFLVSSWEYPADEGMLRFSRDVLRTVLAGEQGGIRHLGSDRVRYAVYEGPHPASRRKVTAVYLLNTDPDCASASQLYVRGRLTRPFGIPPNSLRVAYCLGNLVIMPEDRMVDLASWSVVKNGAKVSFFSVRGQRVEVHNVGHGAQKVTVNGVTRTLRPGECRWFRLKRKIDPRRREFFAPDFLEEPALKPTATALPY